VETNVPVKWYYSICFPGTIFACTVIDLLVQIRTYLDPMIFFTQGLVSLGVELVKNQLHALKDRGSQ